MQRQSLRRRVIAVVIFAIVAAGVSVARTLNPKP